MIVRKMVFTVGEGLCARPETSTYAIAVAVTIAVTRADAGVRPYRYARHEHCLTGESPEQALIAGIA